MGRRCILSPVEVTPLTSTTDLPEGQAKGLTGNSSSATSPTDNLANIEGLHSFGGLHGIMGRVTASLPPTLKKRLSKRSMKLRSSDSGNFSTKEESDDLIEAEGERLLDERETELKRRLQGFEDGTTK